MTRRFDKKPPAAHLVGYLAAAGRERSMRQAAIRQARGKLDDASELSGACADKLLEGDATGREAVARGGPTPIEGILIGVVAGIALWAGVAGAVLLTWFR